MSFSFSIYLPYLRSAFVTSQIIYDVIDVMMPTNHQPARSSIKKRLRSSKFSYNGFFSEPTHNFLDHPSNQEASPQGKTLCAVSVTCVLPRETTTLHTLYLQLIHAGQRREDMTSRRSNNLYALITFQGQESWMQVARIALWTKSRRAHGVFY